MLPLSSPSLTTAHTPPYPPVPPRPTAHLALLTASVFVSPFAVSMAHARRPGLSDSAIGAALDETVSSLQDSDASYISVSEDEYDPAKDSSSESDDSDPGGGA